MFSRLLLIWSSLNYRQNLRCSLIQAVNQEEPSDRKPDPWPLWMAGHAQLKFVITECLKTQIRLTGLILLINYINIVSIWQNQCMIHDNKLGQYRKTRPIQKKMANVLLAKFFYIGRVQVFFLYVTQ